MIGITAMGRSVAETLANIERAETLGIPMAWLTTASPGPDAVTLFAAAATRTQRVGLGTAVVPTYPRHPLMLAQQAQVVAALAPGRFRLGIGSSHRPTIETVFGLRFDQPLAHLREYIEVLRAAFSGTPVDYAGRYFTVKAKLPAPLDVPILISALRPAAFRLAGELADGAISWVCPLPYLRDKARPALHEAAALAGRPAPPLVAHIPVCVHDSAEEVFAAARSRLAGYPRLPFYANMFVEAGFPEAREGALSDAMISALVVHGDEATVAQRLREAQALPMDEVLAMPIPAGPDARASEDRTLRLLAQVARE